MKRRSKISFTQIHVSIPVRLKEEFDELVGFEHSRSKKICRLMELYMSNDGQMIADASTRQLMSYMMARDDCDQTLKVILRGLLNVQKPDEQSS